MATDSSHPFGALLRRYRTLAGFTQESLAERAGISTRAVSDLERGVNHAPRAETLELIVTALGLSPQERAALIAAAHPTLHTYPEHAENMAEVADRSGLPLPPTPLIGREVDLLRGLRLLRREETRLLTVIGPGGVGKTHLALELARQSASRFASGVVFVDLTSIHDAALVPAALALALGLRESRAATLPDALKAALRNQSILLLLDNVEQVVECAPLLADLLAACPNLSLLVTSRTPLRLRAEQTLTLEPLALPDATALFYARATALRDDLTLAPAEVSTVCEQVDCLPLAIELCAAQLIVISLADLRQRLSAGIDLPHAGVRDLPPRHQTLRQAIGWSNDLLPQSAQALFRRLAIFAGGATLPASQAVCAPMDNPACDVLPDLTTLVDSSLLRMRNLAGGAARYDMLATIQSDARDRLRAAGEEEVYASRHAHYFADFDGDESALTREMPNARAALAWARDSGKNSLGMTLLARYARTWYHSGLLTELQTWLETFLALDAASVAPAPQVMRANTLFGAARLAYDRGESEGAAALAEESLLAARFADDAECMSNALALLGQIALASGAMEQANALFEESLVCARRCNVPHVLSAALGNCAQIAQAQGNLARAVVLLEETLAIARQSASLWGEALTETHLGLLAFAQRDYQQARQHYASALALYRAFGSDVYLAWCLEAVAALDSAEGHYARAVGISAGAEALRAKGHAPRPADEQWSFERLLASCHTTLGESAYQRAWEAGAAAVREELIRLALSEAGAP